MTDVGGLDVLLAWIEFAVFVGGMLTVLLRRTGPGSRRRAARPDDGTGPSADQRGQSTDGG